jgi:hypothetical protein
MDASGTDAQDATAAPSSNVTYWNDKRVRNSLRDRSVNKELRQLIKLESRSYLGAPAKKNRSICLANQTFAV